MNTDRNNILVYYKGLAACSKELISGAPKALVNALKELLTSTGVDRVALFENFIDSSGRSCARTVYSLMARGIDEPADFQEMGRFVYGEHSPQWEKPLEKGDVIFFDHSFDFKFKTRMPGIKKTGSTLLVPLFTGNYWHGFVIFETLTILRTWQSMEIEILTTASEMLGGYIEKDYYISALIKGEERYRSIIENINEGYFEVDLFGVFTFVNTRLCRMSRRTRKDFIGMSYRDVVDPETGKSIFEVAKIIYETGMPSGLNHSRVLRQDGSFAVYEHSIALIEDVQGIKKGFRGIVRDITKIIDQEQKKKELEDKCFQMEKLRSIATLAGGLAHDFNNLLMGIQGNTSVLQVKYNSDPMIHGKIKNIERCIKKGAEITNKLLGFARSGKYRERKININTLISGVCGLFGRTRKDIRIDQKYDPDLYWIKGDSGQIEQVFMNLFLNAGQAMPQGGDLRIITENYSVNEAFAFLHDAEPGEYVKITVSDTGIGMDELTRKRVFEPFFTTREKGGGTGLGLASVYGIVKNHWGMITLDSKKGQGTSFILYFPGSFEVDQTVVFHGGEYEMLVDTPDNTPVKKAMSTILLVDDEKLVLDINIEILEALGYRVLSAVNYREAVQIFADNLKAIDLVILDVIMPDKDGFETAKLLRKIKQDVKILFISGYPKKHEKFKNSFIPSDMFIQKPYTLEQLDNILNEALGDKNR